LESKKNARIGKLLDSRKLKIFIKPNPSDQKNVLRAIGPAETKQQLGLQGQ
jgi:hypothetical protein